MQADGQALTPSVSSPRATFSRHSALCATERSIQPGSPSAAIPAAIAAAFTLNGPRTRAITSATAGGM